MMDDFLKVTRWPFMIWNELYFICRHGGHSERTNERQSYYSLETRSRIKATCTRARIEAKGNKLNRIEKHETESYLICKNVATPRLTI